MLAAEKRWVGRSVRWVANAHRLPGYNMRAALALSDGLQPATLFVTAYFKAARIPGAADKLYLSLHYNGRRIHGLDDNAPSRHRNDVGQSEPLFGQLISHPHRHRICDEAVEGYAEPMERLSPAEMWTTFLAECNILGAPNWYPPPPTQTVMSI